jgi:ribosomal protein S18 acetylase RimI-like enzyme
VKQSERPPRRPWRVVIGLARHADLPHLVALGVAADEAERAFSPDLVIRRPDRRHALRSFKRALRERAQRMLVARVGHRVVGMLGIDLHRARHRYVVVRRHAFLHSLYVLSAYRRHGVGRRLIAQALRLARRDGAWQVRLDMAAGNRAARRAYEAAGFRVREMFFTLDLPPLRRQRWNSGSGTN